VSTVDIMTRVPDLLPGTLALLIYPALHRLEHKRWIDAEWKVSELGRRAKYYRPTASGRRQLAVEAREWERMAHAIGRVMKLA